MPIHAGVCAPLNAFWTPCPSCLLGRRRSLCCVQDRRGQSLHDSVVQTMVEILICCVTWESFPAAVCTKSALGPPSGCAWPCVPGVELLVWPGTILVPRQNGCYQHCRGFGQPLSFSDRYFKFAVAVLAGCWDTFSSQNTISFSKSQVDILLLLLVEKHVLSQCSVSTKVR